MAEPNAWAQAIILVALIGVFYLIATLAGSAFGPAAVVYLFVGLIVSLIGYTSQKGR